MTTAKNAVFNGLQVENWYSLGGGIDFWLGLVGGVGGDKTFVRGEIF